MGRKRKGNVGWGCIVVVVYDGYGDDGVVVMDMDNKSNVGSTNKGEKGEVFFMLCKWCRS